jgi:hypothetical protein
VASVPPRVESEPTRSSWALLATILAVGFALRVAAGFFVQWYANRLGKPCLFGDTLIYWGLARAIRMGGPFVVNQFGVPHFALRTPGYPLFLAVCQWLFGAENYLAVRLVQAGLGTLGVYFVYRLVGRVVPGRSAAIVVAALAAVEPYGVGLGALILSEGVFVPLMVAGLWGLAVLWPKGAEPGPRHPALKAVATGIVHGAAILVRPSWALIVPLLLLALAILGGRRAFRAAAIIGLATAAVLAPWWVRNYSIFGRFVPTALWVGASLYDGLSPIATGASDMDFLALPGIVELDEAAQDAELRQAAIAFARSNPARAIELALIKAGRFWSPWPNAETLRSPMAAWLSAAVTLPLFALAAVGTWDRRRDARALILLAGPLAYFFVLHMVFVSSIRYRIPGFLPALGLAAVGLGRLRGEKLP